MCGTMDKEVGSSGFCVGSRIIECKESNEPQNTPMRQSTEYLQQKNNTMNKEVGSSSFCVVSRVIECKQESNEPQTMPMRQSTE